MSLRDDLDVVMYVSDADATKEAYLRLRAALTPAAEKWLEALPELLELEKRATHCETPGVSFTVNYYNGGSYVSWASEDLKLWHSVRNALHEATRLHADESALNAQDNKEQK